MSKHDIECACGHMHSFQIYGPGKHRADKAEWLAEQSCPDCQKAEWEQARERANEAAAAWAIAAKLPVLTGTEKQIAWAGTIRQAAIAKLDALHAALNAKGREACGPVIEQTRGKTSAAWWIEHRAVGFDVDWLRGQMEDVK